MRWRVPGAPSDGPASGLPGAAPRPTGRAADRPPGVPHAYAGSRPDPEDRHPHHDSEVAHGGRISLTSPLVQSPPPASSSKVVKN